MKMLCTILARAGSKGVPNKNIKLLHGKPLIAYSIETARATNLFPTIAVSSDSAEILAVAKQYGADILIRRPEELASDTAPKLPAIVHCVEQVERELGIAFDAIVDLDPTSPLRNVDDVRECVDLLVHGDATNVITAYPARKSPYFNMVELDASSVARVSKQPREQVFCRQDAPKVYDMNGSIYVWWRRTLFENPNVWQEKTRLFVMPPERSVDIDSELDFALVELLLSKTKKTS